MPTFPFPRHGDEPEYPPVALIYLTLGGIILLSLYTAVIFILVWIIVDNRRTIHAVHVVLFCASLVMFFNSCAFLGVVLGGNFNDPDDELVTSLLLIIQYATAYGVLVWRVWLVWNRVFWVIIVPIASLATSIGFGLHSAVTYPAGSGYSPVSNCLAVASTFLCTGLIVFRIWWVQLTVTRLTDGRITHSLRDIFTGGTLFLIETGALFCASQVVILVLFFVQHPALPIMINIEMPLTGLLPSLIVLRFYLSRNKRSQPDQTLVSTFRVERSTFVTVDGVSTKGSRTLQAESFPDVEMQCQTTQTTSSDKPEFFHAV